jgi:hypothetical protein
MQLSMKGSHGNTWIFLAIVICFSVSSVSAGEYFTDFSSNTDWEGPLYQHGITEVGDAYTSDGILTVTQNPGFLYHPVTMKKEITMDMLPNTWFHFRTRTEESLLGADLYISIYLNNEEFAVFGFNGEQHWQRSVFINGNRSECVEDEYDDDFFIGSVKFHDVRTGYPQGALLKYTDWTLYSVKYETDADGSRIRYFVNGNEIDYSALDAGCDADCIDRTIPSLLTGTQDKVTIYLGSFGDGNSYDNPNFPEPGEPVRGMPCWAENTPAIPVNESVSPSLAVQKTAKMLWDYVIVSDDNGKANLQSFVTGLIYDGRMATNDAIILDLLDWEVAQFNCPYIQHDDIREVRSRVPEAYDFCKDRVLDDIFAGYIGTSQAIVTGVIGWEHTVVNCPYMSEMEKQVVRTNSVYGDPSYCL